MEWDGDMNRKVIKYNYVVEDVDNNTTTSTELYIDPNSLAYTLYKENKLGDLDRHLESIMRKK